MNASFNLYNLAFGTRNRYQWGTSHAIKYSETSPKKVFSSSKSNNSITVENKHLNEVILEADSPKALAEYVKKLDRKVKDFERKNDNYDPEIDFLKDIVDDIKSFIEYKIDFNRLGINPKYLSDEELIEYGSKFAFWTTSLEGTPRNGYERPAAVRNANEYIKFMEDNHPIFAATEFESLIERLPQEALEQDKKIQNTYNAEYKIAYYDYNSLPFSKKLTAPKPRQKFTPIYGKLEKLRKLHDESVENCIYSEQKEIYANRKRLLQDMLDNTN